MILSSVKIDAPPGQAHIIIDVLESMRGQTLSAQGCLGCVLSIEVGASDTIYYQEWWRDRDSLDKHVRSSRYVRVLGAMELSCAPPSIEFFEVSKSGGMDLIETTRRDQSFN